MKLTETDDDLRIARLEYIDLRWKQLHELEVKRGDTAINFLFLVSGGASAAVLAFIGNIAKDGVAIPQSAVWMLGCFALSLIFVGAMKGAIALHVIAIFRNWRSLVGRYQDDKIGWNELVAADENVVTKGDILHPALGVISFVLIVGGVVIGFWKLQEESLRGRSKEAVSTAQDTKVTSPKAGTTRSGTDIDSQRREAEILGGRPGGPSAAPAGEEVRKPDK